MREMSRLRSHSSENYIHNILQIVQDERVLCEAIFENSSKEALPFVLKLSTLEGMVEDQREKVAAH